MEFFAVFIDYKGTMLEHQASNNLKAQAQARPAIAFDDAALVERFRRGDMESFGLLVAKYQDRIYNLMLRMCGRSGIAEELAQDAFVRAMERISQFRSKSSFYTWLFRIAVNLAMSYRRRHGKIQFHSLSTADDDCKPLSTRLTSNQPGAAAIAIKNEIHSRVAANLEELDDEFRIVLILRDMEDMDYAEISNVLDIPIGTVKSRIHRARSMMREKLKDLLEC